MSTKSSAHELTQTNHKHLLSNIYSLCTLLCNLSSNTTPGMRQSKTFTLSPNEDYNRQKQFSNVICSLTGDKWQSKTLYLAIFDPRRRLLTFFDSRLPGVNRVH